MSGILIDSNVILDVMTDDPQWSQWSSKQLSLRADSHDVYINPVIYAEVSIRFNDIEDLEEALPPDMFRRRKIPYEAAFLAGKCFMKYRRRGGAKRSPLPDFFIGAHAAVENWTLLTRDATRYQTYFPRLNLIAP